MGLGIEFARFIFVDFELAGLVDAVDLEALHPVELILYLSGLFWSRGRRLFELLPPLPESVIILLPSCRWFGSVSRFRCQSRRGGWLLREYEFVN